MSPRLRNLLLLLLGAIVLVAAIHLWMGSADEPAPFRAPPEITPLSSTEFATPDELLLERVSSDAMRRIIAGGKGWRSGPQVLPAAQCHLWTIAVLQPTIEQIGFVGAMAQQKAPSPMGPAMHDLAVAYGALGLDGLAAVVGEAEGQDQAQGDGDLDARFRAELATSGCFARRVAYARSHKREILSEPAE